MGRIDAHHVRAPRTARSDAAHAPSIATDSTNWMSTIWTTSNRPIRSSQSNNEWPAFVEPVSRSGAHCKWRTKFPGPQEPYDRQ